MSAPRSQGAPARSKEMAPEDVGRWIFAIAKHLTPSTALMDFLSTYAMELERLS